MTLYEHYKGQGQPLPSVEARKKIYEGQGLKEKYGEYAGTTSQNVALLAALRQKSGAPVINAPAIIAKVSESPEQQLASEEQTFLSRPSMGERYKQLLGEIVSPQDEGWREERQWQELKCL